MKKNFQLFGRVIDLTEKLSDEKPKIKIKDDELEVNDGFKSVLKVDALLKNKDIDQLGVLNGFFEIVFGKAGAKKLMDKDYSISFYKEIMSSVLELIKGDDQGE